MSNQKKKAIVGLSGGVDSSVAAALLLREGFEVVGAFMKNWSDGVAGQMCSWRWEYADAQAVAEKLGIPLLLLDYEEDYRRDVYAYMLAEYRAGRTPNPDVLCNEKVKFGPFLRRALEEGADVVATGHYAQVREKAGSQQLLAGIDSNKDQSYFLHRLSQEQLRHVAFPVGELKKSEVRDIARQLGLPVAEKKDSVGICFIGEKNMAEFLARDIPGRPGPIVSTEGRVVGRHSSVVPFTIGQRHGMNITDGQPYFVVGKDMARNTLIVARGEDPAELYSRELAAEDIHWISGEPPQLPLRCRARVRYRQPLQDCEVRPDHTVVFDQPQRAIAPGQFVVFYDGEVCLGGGIIKNTSDS
ncbi:MAG: tRNA 2-thiouridine(34) synthase MnmA [Patescibacteria group bacterium]